MASDFKIHNDSKGGTDKWLCYTTGSTTFTISSCDKKIHITSTITGSLLVDIKDRDVLQDSIDQGISGTYDDIAVVGVGLYGPTGSGTLYYDAVRFEGEPLTVWTDGSLPSTTPTITAETTDKAAGSNSVRVTPAVYGSSPQKTGNLSILNNPYIDWYWKKVGGTTIGWSFTLEDARDTSKTGTLVYYAGAIPSGLPSGAVALKVSDRVPSDWTKVTRNILEDARQVFGFYNSEDSSASPVPDDARITSWRLLAQDGAYALFDEPVRNSIPNRGPTPGALNGPDFTVTLPGREIHGFTREGYLAWMDDADGNRTSLVWDYAGSTPLLTTVIAPSDGLSLSSGTAVRRLEITRPGTSVRFTEKVGASGDTGRYAEFVKDVTLTDVTAIVPARRSSACAGSAPTGCTGFVYTSHRLTRINDPRSASYYTTIGYNGSNEPTSINEGTSNAQLRIVSYASGGSYVRPEWQDADGIVAGYARFKDLTPNGAVLNEYRPVNCSGSCATAVPGDKLASFTTDGINNYSTETRYRRASNQGPVITRRGTYAGAKVDNYSDPLTAGLTAWTQSAAQYAASEAAGDLDKYRTDITYNGAYLQATTRTPFTNPSDLANPVYQTVVTTYDAVGHPLQVSDAGFVLNPGFEDDLSSWTVTGGAVRVASPVDAGRGALSMPTSTAKAEQTVTLLPGQTFRLQAAIRSTTGTTKVRVEAQKASDGQFDTANPLVEATTSLTTFDPKSVDLTIPVSSNGKIRVMFSTTGGGFADSVVVLTSYAASTYGTFGLLETKTDILGIVTKHTYAAATKHPAIFATKVTQGYKSGSPADADTNVETNRTFDAWGRELTNPTRTA